MTWEYLAGFFDGEGSISCRDLKSGHRSTRLTLTNTNREVLQAAHEFLAVNGIKSSLRCFRESRRKEWKDCYALYLTGAKNVYITLLHLAPHLIVKRMDALIGIEWLWDLAERAASGEFDGFRNNYAKYVYMQILDVEVLAEMADELTEEVAA